MRYYCAQIEKGDNMATARKLPSGSYRVRVFVGIENGKKKYKSFTAKTKKEAEYAATQYLIEKKDNESESSITFGDALTEYIESRETILSPRTIMDYKRIRNKEIQGLMPVRIDDITQDMIQKLINEDAKVHSPKTVRNTHGIISAVLKKYRPSFALNTTLPKAQKPDLYIPTDDDVKKLIAYAKGTNMELPILLAAFGPMRRGEICALNTDNIDGNIVHVCQNMVRKETDHVEWIIKSPKTYTSDRFIQYPDFVAELWKGKNGYITELNPNNITDRFNDMLKSAKIHHFRFHDLRHYCASIQHAMGIPDAYIMQRGGWASDNVLKNVYRHAMSDRQKEMNNKANNHFSKLYDTKYDTKK